MAACMNYTYPPENDLPLEDEDAITETPPLDSGNGESDQSPANGDDTRPLLAPEPESSPVVTAVLDHTQDVHHVVQPDVAVAPSPEVQLPLTPPPTPANVGVAAAGSSESRSVSGRSRSTSARGSSQASPDSNAAGSEPSATRHASGPVNSHGPEPQPGSTPGTWHIRGGVLADLLRRRLSRQTAGGSQDDSAQPSPPGTASRAALGNRFTNQAILISQRLFASQGPREDNDLAGASTAARPLEATGGVTVLNSVPVSSETTTSPPKGPDVEDVVETVRGIQAKKSFYNTLSRIWKNALNGLVNNETGEIVFGLTPQRRLQKKPVRSQSGEPEPNEASTGNQEAIHQQEESPSGLVPQVVTRTAVSDGVDRAAMATVAPTLASERDTQQPARTGSAQLSGSTATAGTTPPAEGSSPERGGSASDASANRQDEHITFAPEPSREEAARASPNVVLPPTPASSPTRDGQVETAPRPPSPAVTRQTENQGLGRRLRGRVERFTKRFRLRRALARS
ncbi:hypothetical protein VTN31DRAFT_6001 [Thermomyces dupontii]|uniref:uncharacterized protein n=1 Tax=Talaromyces thermophilus TaxID=28565 RepID=UPI0037431CCA